MTGPRLLRTGIECAPTAGARPRAGVTTVVTNQPVRIAPPVLRGDSRTRIVVVPARRGAGGGLAWGGAAAAGAGAVPDGAGTVTGAPDAGPGAGAGPGSGDGAGAVPAVGGAGPRVGVGVGAGAGPGVGPGVGAGPDGGAATTLNVLWVLACCNCVESQHQTRHPICICQMDCWTTATAVPPGGSDAPGAAAMIWIVVVDCCACCTCFELTQ